MKETKEVKSISLGTAACLFVILILIFIILIMYYLGFVVNKKGEEEIQTNNTVNTSGDNIVNIPTINIEKEPEKENEKVEDYFIVYKGYEMKKEVGVQTLTDMKKTDSNTTKYTTKYYNYENCTYLGETMGDFYEEMFEGMANVGNVKKIAISEKYNAIPRTYTTIKELPKELNDMMDYTKVDIRAIDLDGDNKKENIVCYNYDYIGENENENKALSGIILMDSNYKKIADLVTLEDGFWAGIKTEENKRFLTIEDVEYLDIDNDGIMEILIEIPTYESLELSILKYKNNKVEGKTDIKADLLP